MFLITAVFLRSIYTFQQVSVSVPFVEQPIIQSTSDVEKKDETAIFFQAYDEYGNAGYVADPQTLQRRVVSVADWELWSNYEPQTSKYSHHQNNLSSENVCSLGPGEGLEEEGGYKILTEKAQLNHSKRRSQKRILCLMYTHEPMHSQARAAALTWGRRCDGFLGFSNLTIPSLGLLRLEHVGPENYGNMYQKVRSIWAYVHQHYLSDYEYFHLCGDDAYLLVENLRHFVESLDDTQPVFAGQIVPFRDWTYVAGGAGYTLNRMALQTLIQTLPTCFPNARVSFEDRLLSQCFKKAGVSFFDTRDYLGEQRYHDCAPQHLWISRASTRKRAHFHSKAAAYWENLTFPQNNTRVGPQVGLATTSASSIAFHNIYSPLYQVRMDVILHRACPAESVLGKAMH